MELQEKGWLRLDAEKAGNSEASSGAGHSELSLLVAPGQFKNPMAEDQSMSIGRYILFLYFNTCPILYEVQCMVCKYIKYEYYIASHLVAKEAEVQRPIRQQQAHRIAGRGQGQVTAHAALLVLQVEYPQVHLRIRGKRSPSEAY